MKALSLWQPWSALWLSPRKIYETRSWPTAHRGWLLVHAAKRIEHDVDDELRAILEDDYGGHWGTDLRTGALVGRVDIVTCRRTEDVVADPKYHGTDDVWCGNFYPGRFAWERGDFELLPAPIPWRGQRRLFEVPDAILPQGWAS